jgi:hypothetical protein
MRWLCANPHPVLYGFKAFFQQLNLSLKFDTIGFLTEIKQPCIHMCDSLFICQLYSLPDLFEETECKEDMPLTLPFASFVSLSQLIIVI